MEMLKRRVLVIVIFSMLSGTIIGRIPNAIMCNDVTLLGLSIVPLLLNLVVVWLNCIMLYDVVHDMNYRFIREFQKQEGD